jgi:hypothetical protein
MIAKSPLTTPHVEENLEEVIESNQIGALLWPSVKFWPPGCDKALVKFVTLQLHGNVPGVRPGGNQ